MYFISMSAIFKDVQSNQIICHQREAELEQQKTKYKWQKFEDLAVPSGIDVSVNKLPSDEQFGAVKEVDFLASALASKGTLMLKTAFSAIQSLANYINLATTLGIAEFSAFEISRWTRDEEFGRQILNGVNPVIIRRCNDLPPNFPVDATTVEASLARGLSLEDEMKVSLQITALCRCPGYLINITKTST